MEMIKVVHAAVASGSEPYSVDLDHKGLRSSVICSLVTQDVPWKGIVQLNLHQNRIGDDAQGIRCLCDLILGHETLVKLVLSSNQLSDSHIKCISECLSRNPRMKSINLSRNEISDTGGSYILDSLDSNENIEWIELSNNRLSPIRLREIEDKLISRSLNPPEPCVTQTQSRKYTDLKDALKSKVAHLRNQLAWKQKRIDLQLRYLYRYVYECIL